MPTLKLACNSPSARHTAEPNLLLTYRNIVCCEIVHSNFHREMLIPHNALPLRQVKLKNWIIKVSVNGESSQWVFDGMRTWKSLCTQHTHWMAQFIIHSLEPLHPFDGALDLLDVFIVIMKFAKIAKILQIYLVPIIILVFINPIYTIWYWWCRCGVSKYVVCIFVLYLF